MDEADYELAEALRAEIDRIDYEQAMVLRAEVDQYSEQHPLESSASSQPYVSYETLQRQSLPYEGVSRNSYSQYYAHEAARAGPPIGWVQAGQIPSSDQVQFSGKDLTELINPCYTHENAEAERPGPPIGWVQAGQIPSSDQVQSSGKDLTELSSLQ